MKIVINRNNLFFIGSFIIFLYYLPYFILGENAHIQIHDNLDSSIIYIKILLENKAVFASPDFLIIQVFGGLPRSSLYPFYDIGILWLYLFGIYWGYVVSKIIMSAVAFVGMFLLLQKLLVKDEHSFLILGFVSLLFSLLPFWSINLTIAGLPLVSYAFINIRNGHINFTDYLIIIIFAFYSSLILVGVFYLMVLVVIFISDYLKFRTFNFPFFIGIFGLSLLYVISHYPLFYSFILTPHESHRVEFSTAPIGVKTALKEFIKMFTIGQYHAHSLHLFIIPFVVIAVILQIKFKEYNRLFFGILIFIIATSFLYGFIHFKYGIQIFEWLKNIIPIQLQRFHFLHPVLWMILFAISLIFIKQKISRSFNFILFLAVIFNLLYVISHHELIVNRDSVSFQEFFAAEQFEEIKDYIGNDHNHYKTISVGMHPAIAQFNNFMTLDGYFADYPLSYKHRFRGIIEGELERSEQNAYYFDNWGSRCYALSSELSDFSYYKQNPASIYKLDFDFLQFRNMGGKYIFSAVEINEEIKDIIFLKKFENKQSAWDIYLYVVNEDFII